MLLPSPGRHHPQPDLKYNIIDIQLGKLSEKGSEDDGYSLQSEFVRDWDDANETHPSFEYKPFEKK